ncbi:rhodanese-like domain-containing protein [Bacterioplanes sanyensis]|uniref:rhodanese-like domain-containing protein n=1 Tax=Bacterioplanes sanyensis TaxID=1249553 RepID=UPI0016773AC3|nr:rhodanese-like domain-containing protein [Bacterioplanes sanyensis]GGY38972.1 rhodanese-like domain-containing protein [Bacterioplanes sanyensis]
MDQLFEFIGNHVWLVAIWTAFLLALIWDNRQRSGASVSVAQATVMINKEDAVVLDIRDKKDYRAGHVTNAINIPYANLANRLGELSPHKEKPIILVCKTGQTVSMAGKMLREKGFNAVRLQGGMMEWTAQNLPVVKK